MGISTVSDPDSCKRRFEQIIGKSSALRAALDQVLRVAPTDSTVLIVGETGVGKELIAHAVHNVSPRCGRPYVTFNCAAIPFDLFESELFGHERGAFTGAIAPRMGRFELADKGTLFLDEVGDIPLALQPKLLRVLQERQFERLGSAEVRRVNVRLVAATNRDLSALVSSKQFREDLFYRLNVFPISLPPLRSRKGDIPLLAEHFVRTHSDSMNKRITTIPKETIDALEHYAWPGNVRELQNFIERSVILTDGPTLCAPLWELNAATAAGTQEPITFNDAQREHIRKTLERTSWVVSGPRGAASRLGMKRSTLQYRIRKLGITRSALGPPIAYFR